MLKANINVVNRDAFRLALNQYAPPYFKYDNALSAVDLAYQSMVEQGKFPEYFSANTFASKAGRFQLLLHWPAAKHKAATLSVEYLGLAN